MPRIMIPMAIIVIAIGCQSESDRVAELAIRHATEQSQLSRETIELQAELVKGTQQVVDADALARRDFIELEGKLDEQRAAIADERREIAKHRHRAPVVASALITVGSLLACLLPLVLAGYLLRCQLSEPDDHSLTEVLLDEIAAGHPVFAASNDPLLAHASSRPPPRIGGEDVEQRPSDDPDQPTHVPD